MTKGGPGFGPPVTSTLQLRLFEDCTPNGSPMCGSKAALQNAPSMRRQ
jgi:hypothetical protein